MTRTIQDQDLLLWEAYASTGDFGFPEHSKIVFHCLTDPALRARILARDGDKSDVEHELATLSSEELTALLSKTEPLK